MDILTAWELGASQITAVEVNPLIVSAADDIYHRRRVRVVLESDRSYLRRSKEAFDIILLSLSSSYHPVRSGAYSLAEDYRYTLEAFQDLLARLKPDGLLVVTRWLQTPPSESLRTFALGISALEASGLPPAECLVAYRSYNTATLLVKNGHFTPPELQEIREFTESRAYDLIYAPDINPQEVNQHNILPEPEYYQTFTALLNSQPRQNYYSTYPFNVSPPTDDHPFFGHFFKWSQAKQVWAELGKTWQPFGGAGYFVILALLLIATLLAIILVLLPAAASLFHHSPSNLQGITKVSPTVPYLLYFAWIGFAFLLVEIPLIQRFILYLGHPAYAMTAVLFTILLFSGLGSYFGKSMPLVYALGFLVAILFVAPMLLPVIFNLSLGLALGYRLCITLLLLAPIGFLMGIPFPSGIGWLLAENDRSHLIPWVWGVNGATSVVSAVLAALLALSFGFGWVLRIGALCYAGAMFTILITGWRAPASRPRR